MTLNGMSSDPHNGVNSLDWILMRLSNPPKHLFTVKMMIELEVKTIYR